MTRAPTSVAAVAWSLPSSAACHRVASRLLPVRAFRKIVANPLAAGVANGFERIAERLSTSTVVAEATTVVSASQIVSKTLQLTTSSSTSTNNNDTSMPPASKAHQQHNDDDELLPELQHQPQMQSHRLLGDHHHHHQQQRPDDDDVKPRHSSGLGGSNVKSTARRAGGMLKALNDRLCMQCSSLQRRLQYEVRHQTPGIIQVFSETLRQ